jgi:hypothetical protein
LSNIDDSFLFCFSDLSSFDFDKEGFGSVFDGVFSGGSFENLSTQAVMDLIRNVNDEAEGNGSGVVVIDAQDVEDFHIPRVEANNSETSNGEVLLN